MRITNALLAAGVLGIGIAMAQGPQPPAPPGGPDARRAGGLVPGQKRAPEDPVQIARGKTLYGISCTACHGTDLRGGDLGGPNLLRSQVALSDSRQPA
jgi:cytochrome c oxidase cbb3-type subunit 3